jgi:geranylgeranyl reductase family protein
MEKYDTIIVGAGPGGLNAAKFLQKSKKSILVIEQNKTIGPKICAAGLTQKSYDYLNLPNKLIHFKFNKIKINFPLIPSYLKLKKSFVYTIDRTEIANHQLSKLNKKYVTIIKNTRVTKINKNHIITTNNNNNKIYFNNLIGADGSNSTVRKHLKLKTKNQGIAIQYIIPTNKYNNMKIFLDSKLFKSWYAWIFPHKNYVSIGCGCDPRDLKIKKLKQNFKIWLKQNKINTKNAKLEGFPINCDYKKLKFKDNIFLIGDAAGLASSYTGEGIYQALLSGEVIAKTIINPNYKSKHFKKLTHQLHRHNQITKILSIIGPLRNICYIIAGLFLKTKIFDRKIVKLFS